MTDEKSGALHHLQLTLAKWQNPSAWDRIVQDEPLDPVEGKWVSNVACNASADGTISITVGVSLSTAAGQVFTVTDVNRTEIAVARIVGTRIEQAGQYPSTAYPYGNEPDPARPLPAFVPYPRNHKERRIYKSIERKLPELIRKAERKLGPRELSEEWNDRFWNLVTIKRNSDRQE